MKKVLSQLMLVLATLLLVSSASATISPHCVLWKTWPVIGYEVFHPTKSTKPTPEPRATPTHTPSNPGSKDDGFSLSDVKKNITDAKKNITTNVEKFITSWWQRIKSRSDPEPEPEINLLDAIDISWSNGNMRIARVGPVSLFLVEDQL